MYEGTYVLKYLAVLHISIVGSSVFSLVQKIFFTAYRLNPHIHGIAWGRNSENIEPPTVVFQT
ncbi:hypothetical protein GQ53DRAFT_747678 [Thozetella sp. PMI_491]|nr:hypothetical protein GQ53DRAFT_747678 [Thozetella sp. PMI_491]